MSMPAPSRLSLTLNSQKISSSNTEPNTPSYFQTKQAHSKSYSSSLNAADSETLFSNIFYRNLLLKNAIESQSIPIERSVKINKKNCHLRVNCLTNEQDTSLFQKFSIQRDKHRSMYNRLEKRKLSQPQNDAKCPEQWIINLPTRRTKTLPPALNHRPFFQNNHPTLILRKFPFLFLLLFSLVPLTLFHYHDIHSTQNKIPLYPSLSWLLVASGSIVILTHCVSIEHFHSLQQKYIKFCACFLHPMIVHFIFLPLPPTFFTFRIFFFLFRLSSFYAKEDEVLTQTHTHQPVGRLGNMKQKVEKYWKSQGLKL